MENFDITTLVTTYNSEWELVRKTVVSAIKQGKVKHQIVVSDDGSRDNHFEELRALFEEYEFRDYVLLASEENMGTCRNVLRGLEIIKSSYCKLISPGDYYNGDILWKWLDHIKEANADVCFGDAIYYYNNEILAVPRTPRNIKVYNGQFDRKTAYLNYIFLDDAVVGACFIVKTLLFRNYLSKCIPFLMYSEDMVYRSMIVDGVIFSHFNNPAIWYEYGTGVSTKGNSKWENILRQEKQNVYRYIRENNSLGGFEKFRLRIGLTVILNPKIACLKYFIYPELIYWKVKKYMVKGVVVSVSNSDFIEEI